ncbi:hypothetical protein M419DRAFT_131974 [Trichoderma reesei RUT C-30]|uniref:Uncharacterized protein n=1 Tax=Hypocrea jecorina (strain ATCC 56765 / BCRC 32924 / NRRL 11460 / Rut C-30) TaxID=1344414 RepID=A0A024S3N7_HYPJR|nr:hypothetical protein M419DRAFT_131974 [Trichoderma reesei RUT C-30]
MLYLQSDVSAPVTPPYWITLRPYPICITCPKQGVKHTRLRDGHQVTGRAKQRYAQAARAKAR